jgi:hypothetical protein
LLERRLSEPGTDKVLKKIRLPVTDNPCRALDKPAKTAWGASDHHKVVTRGA